VLTVRQAIQAVAFYEQAFGAEELHRNAYPDGGIVAELAIDGGTVPSGRWDTGGSQPQSPGAQRHHGAAHLLVADPDQLAERAIANGAIQIAPIADQSYGLRQGRLADPFGHHWLIGRPLADESGD
jgi:PhnB protein